MANSTRKEHDMLEIETDDEREARIQRALERIETSKQSFSASLQPGILPGGSSKPGPTEPPTELLARLEAFLPQIASSNELLAGADPTSLDIENIASNGDGAYIEMNLGLGLFEERNNNANPGKPTESSECDSESDSSDESTTDSDTSSDELISEVSNTINRIVRPLPKRARPNIVVLEEDIETGMQISEGEQA